MSTKTILDQPEVEQEAAWLLLHAFLRDAAPPRFVRKMLQETSVQHWLLGDAIKALPDTSSPALEAYRGIFQELEQALERRLGDRPFYPESIAYVGDRFGLVETERRVLWLSVLNYVSTGLHDALLYVDTDVSRRMEAAKLIAALIDQPVGDVVRAIGGEGNLMQIGLLEPPAYYSALESYLGISHRIASALHEQPVSEGLFNAFLHPAKPTALSAADFPHLIDDFRHVSRYLQAALRERTPGVNVLFHGFPGTGKTELAAVIAEHLGVPLYAIPDEWSDSRFIADTHSRLSAYRLTQKLLASMPALIVFDDVEDGVLDWEEGFLKKRTSGKSFLNNLLESNPCPAIWITNVAYLFDEAHLRRFDLSVAFKTPPRSVRAGLIDTTLRGLPLSDAFKTTLAEDRHLTPAQVNKIARVVGHIAQEQLQARHNTIDGRLDGLARHVYQASHKLRFGRDAADSLQRPRALEFDPDIVNASLPADRIIELFRRTPGLTGCFHGVSGSGKSALAEHIARSLDQPLLVKRGSDLLRPFLGETEMRLRDMFEEAMDDGALLLLDEADSFLADRERAQRSWEIAQVNELLTQIERYRGHFIATTNAFDVLDPASLRRFDLKVRFDPLRPIQRMQLLEALLRLFGITHDEALSHCREDVVAALNDLPQLTPGDFAVVTRRLITAVQDVDVFTVVDALREEHSVKKPLTRPAGFIG